MKHFLLCLLMLLAGGLLSAQQRVTGFVTGDGDEPLIGVSVKEKGTSASTVSSLDGSFTIRVSAADATLIFNYIGYNTVEIPLAGQTDLKVAMQSGQQLGEVQVVGSRSYRRSSTDSPVAIDVINIAEIPTANGLVEINQILQYAAPSFNATKQSGSDGADHIDPATLRGLGPDQTLVLINGKRRHQSSLINVFGSRGRGNTGTDLNALPVAAIKRIEVLRDGASAQYGSDAIAGVINIVLKDDVGDLSGSITYGAYSTASPDALAGTSNAGGKNRLYDGDKKFDGNMVKIGTNYGLPLGGNGGFANFTTELTSKDRTLRPGADFRKGYGEAAIDGFNFMINSAVPIGAHTKAYAFGGKNYRNTDAYAFTRNVPTARNVERIYPTGFTPRITSIITDASISAGVKHELGSGWNVDFSNTYGKNDFHYYIKNTLNASLEEASPTEFDAGGHNLTQNTTGLDFSKYYKNILSGVNIAFGTEYRTENFQIFAGEEGSYATYDTNGLAIVGPNQVIPVDQVTGEERPGGSQGFPGYSPANEVDRSRSNLAFYLDGEFNFSKSFLVAAALRYENYSDFGETFNYKLAARYNIFKGLALRGSVSSGFRAPSLAQIYYNLRFTNFVGGEAQEVLLSPNNSPVTRGFGIGQLKQETAFNGSVGLTYRKGKFSATIDAYSIDIANRIVLTDYFDATSLGLNVVDAQFFANGLDTRSQGIDVVLNYQTFFGSDKLTLGLTGNINNLEIKKINNGSLDANTFFGPREQYFLRASAPDYKFGLNAGYSIGRFDLAAALTQFSKVTLLDWQISEDDADYGGYANKLKAAMDIYDANMVLDMSINYRLTKKLNFSIGGNNILNAYPTVQDDWTDSGGYWDSVQMGTSGAYYYARLGFRF